MTTRDKSYARRHPTVTRAEVASNATREQCRGVNRRVALGKAQKYFVCLNCAAVFSASAMERSIGSTQIPFHTIILPGEY